MSWAIWITGRPGSGKSTIARQVAAALERRGERVAILEASAFAAETVPGRPPSAHELDIVHRALIRAATELTRAGVPVIIDGTAHSPGVARAGALGDSRASPRSSSCARTKSAARVSKRCAGARWRNPGQQRLVPAEPEIVLDYEYSLRADLTVNTETQHVWSAAEGVLLLIERLHASTARGARQPGETQGTAGPLSV